MRWSVFAIVTFLLLVVQMSVLALIEIGGVRPNLLAVLACFVALWAPRLTALWACLILGILVDLTSPLVFSGFRTAHVIGPNALGFSFAAMLTIQIRAMVMRRKILATAVLSGIFAFAAGVIVVSVLTVRSWVPGLAPELAGFSSMRQLGHHLGVAIYTALAGLPTGMFLHWLMDKWHFHTVPSAAANWR